jgi:hypothetical protein
MKKFALLLFLIFALVHAASASYISLQTTVNSKVTGNLLAVSISAVNKGDESAHNVQAEVRLGKKKVILKKMLQLRVNGVYRAQTSFKLDQKVPGEYPLVVVMHYADANLYPFSALNCQTFSYKAEGRPSELFGKLSSATFWKKGRVKLTLKNLSGAAIKASTYLVVPREISAASESIAMSIPANSEKDASFAMENFSALNGSNYQVFAITEHEREGLHQTTITPATVRIVESQELFGVSYAVIIVVLVMLVLMFIAAQFLGKKKVGN